MPRRPKPDINGKVKKKKNFKGSLPRLKNSFLKVLGTTKSNTEPPENVKNHFAMSVTQDLHSRKFHYFNHTSEILMWALSNLTGKESSFRISQGLSVTSEHIVDSSNPFQIYYTEN